MKTLPLVDDVVVYLCQFLDPGAIAKLAVASRRMHQLVSRSSLYQKLVELKIGDYRTGSVYSFRCLQQGYLEIHQWLMIEKNAPKGYPRFNQTNPYWLCISAYESNDLRVIDWVQTHYSIIPTRATQQQYFICLAQRKKDNTKILQWLVEQQPSLPTWLSWEDLEDIYPRSHLANAKYVRSLRPDMTSNHLIYIAVGNRELEMIQWLASWLPPFDENELFREAAGNGNLPIARWIYQQYPTINLHPPHDLIWDEACSEGNLGTVQWLYSLDPTFDLNLGWSEACVNNNLEVAEWIWSLGRPINVNYQGDRAFRLACISLYRSMAEYVWQKSIEARQPIDLDAPNHDCNESGTNVLEELCCRGNLDWVQWFCSLGYLDLEGNNHGAFFWACYELHFPVCDWLWSITPFDLTPIFLRFCKDFPCLFSLQYIYALSQRDYPLQPLTLLPSEVDDSVRPWLLEQGLLSE